VLTRRESYASGGSSDRVEDIFRLIASHLNEQVIITLMARRAIYNAVDFDTSISFEMTDESKMAVRNTIELKNRLSERFLAEVQRLRIPPLLGERFFSTEELRPYSKPGKSSVSGQAFLRTRGGDIRIGAGCEVQLFPTTDYITHYISQHEQLEQLQATPGFWRFMGDTSPVTEEARIAYRAWTIARSIEPLDVREVPFQKTAIADANGNFEFRDLPAGEYTLTCTITWQVGSETSGGLIVKSLKVEAGEAAKVMMTR
jgi:hypothetical protein